MTFATAKLFELDDAQAAAKSGGKTAVVQFNPDSLKVSYANQVVDPPGKTKSQGQGTSGRQYVGAGTTKLSLQLWFDVHSPMPGEEAQVDDVRRLTSRVTALMHPEASGDPKVFVPPVVRFEWGSFKFDGLVDSLEETLEYFSEQGVPLRASMSLAMSQQKILVAQFGAGGGGGAGLGSPGASPLAQAAQGSTLQGLAEAAGKGADWQSIAAANGIENPRSLPVGQLVDLARQAMG